MSSVHLSRFDSIELLPFRQRSLQLHQEVLHFLDFQGPRGRTSSATGYDEFVEAFSPFGQRRQRPAIRDVEECIEKFAPEAVVPSTAREERVSLSNHIANM